MYEELCYCGWTTDRADEKERMVSIVQVEVKVMQGSTGLVSTKPLKKCNKKDPDRAGRGLSKEQSER